MTFFSSVNCYDGFSLIRKTLKSIQKTKKQGEPNPRANRKAKDLIKGLKDEERLVFTLANGNSHFHLNKAGFPLPQQNVTLIFISTSEAAKFYTQLFSLEWEKKNSLSLTNKGYQAKLYSIYKSVQELKKSILMFFT